MNLDTGQTITTPDDPKLIKHYDQWMDSARADLITGAYSTGNKPAGLVLRKMKSFARFSAGEFDSLSPELTELAARYMPAQDSSFLGPLEMSPSTAIFATLGGTVGIIQIVSISDSPPTLTLRYKLIQQPGK